MDVAYLLFFTGLFGLMIGFLGGMVMVKLIDQGNIYLHDHPPDKEENNKKEGDCNGRN